MADGRSCVFRAALESTEREGLERPRSPPHHIARAHRPLIHEPVHQARGQHSQVQSAAAILRAHASSPDFAVWKLRLRTRHLKLIMGCVECNVCKVHGTVLVIGLASTLQARHEV